MRETPRIEAQVSRVTALFDGSVRVFPLPEGATFADLADRLDRLSFRADGQAVAITLKFRWSVRDEIPLDRFSGQVAIPPFVRDNSHPRKDSIQQRRYMRLGTPRRN